MTNTTATTSLTAFLLNRIAEDEADARTCAEMFPSPWEIADRGWRVRIYASDVPTEDLMSDIEGAMTIRQPVVMEVEPDRRIEHPQWLSERVAHIARHDPARVLAECAAKRAIVATHQGWHVCPYSTDDGRDRGYTDFGDGCGVEWEDVCPTLRHLAAVYADHPGYDPAWVVS